MFGFSKRNNEELDNCINMLLVEIRENGADAPEFPELLNRLERLHKLKSEEDNKQRVSPEVVWTVVGNIVCVVLVIGYEQKHVISSKAMTFIARLGNRN